MFASENLTFWQQKHAVFVKIYLHAGWMTCLTLAGTSMVHSDPVVCLSILNTSDVIKIEHPINFLMPSCQAACVTCGMKFGCQHQHPPCNFAGWMLHGIRWSFAYLSIDCGLLDMVPCVTRLVAPCSILTCTIMHRFPADVRSHLVNRTLSCLWVPLIAGCSSAEK